MKKHGCIWWVFIGWWWVPITLPFRIPVAIMRLLLRALNPAPKQAEPEQAQELEQHQEPEKKKETLKVAGVSYRQDALRALGTKNPDFVKSKNQLVKEGLMGKWIQEYTFDPEKVELIPEPDNPYSENGTAVMVVVDGQHIGYIKSESSAHVGELLREDRIQRVTCFIGGGKRKRISWDADEDDDGGIDTDKMWYTMESDEVGFYARINITKKTE